MSNNNNNIVVEDVLADGQEDDGIYVQEKTEKVPKAPISQRVRDWALDVKGDFDRCLPQDNVIPTPADIKNWAVSSIKDTKDFVVESAYFYKDNKNILKNEILSGITVSIMQVPESVAFSFVAGVEPIVGLYSTFFMAVICSALGGQPGMINGAAGSLAVVVPPLVAAHGPEYLFVTMVMAGMIQFIIGLLGLAKFVKLIPQTAMLGFFNGLAIIIFISQLYMFRVTDTSVGCTPTASYDNCSSVSDAIASLGDNVATTMSCTAVATGCECLGDFVQKTQWGKSIEDLASSVGLACVATKVETWVEWHSRELWLGLIIVFVTMVITHLFPRLTRFIPASLMALLVGTFIEHVIYRIALGLKTTTVGEQQPLLGVVPTFHVPDVQASSEMFSVTLPYAFSLAAIGLIEAVMTLQALDEIMGKAPDTRASNQECLAQGLGNFVCGWFGAMGGTAMIGQSTINVINGAQGRLSGVMSGFFMLILIVAAGPAIELIPVAALTGVLFIVVVYTFQWSTFRTLLRIPFMDAVNVVMVTLLAVFTNLGLAVGAGVILSALSFSWAQAARVKVVATDNSATDTAAAHKVYAIHGPLFFASAFAFNHLFNSAEDPDHTAVHFESSGIFDYSALIAINKVGKTYTDAGKKLHLHRFSEEDKEVLLRASRLVDEVHHSQEPVHASLSRQISLDMQWLHEGVEGHVVDDLEELPCRSIEYTTAGGGHVERHEGAPRRYSLDLDAPHQA